MKFSTKNREIIKNRANGSCEVCGVTLRVYAQIHHRRPRGMGGTKQQVAGSPANGLYVHQKCHETIERNRSTGLRKGWLVRQGDDPVQVPVQLWYGWRLLRDDGSVEVVDDAKRPSYLDRIEGAGETVPSGVGANESDDGPLADTKFGGDEVGGNPF